MDFASIVTPTLIIDPDIVRSNIARMADKARSQHVHFRPHFKTHQSAHVGEWFRDYGVQAITVSSLEMASYFASHGWTDITVAFPLNLRQMDLVRSLAAKIHLGVLVESEEAVKWLGGQLDNSVDVWIKVDSGSGRTGIAWQDEGKAIEVAIEVQKYPKLVLRGLLTHAGWTYSASSVAEVIQRYQLSNHRMLALRDNLLSKLSAPIEVSVGDTPGCSLCESLGAVDEIRPGNFVFYDAQMLRLGACSFEQIAGIVACPVVALHPEREEVMVYGGAIHLSKDTFIEDGKTKYGLVVLIDENGWSRPIYGAYAARLSQEHGVLHIPLEEISKIKIGGLVGIVPAHVCLTVSALVRYMTFEGEQITTQNCAP